MHMKISFANWRPFCLCISVLTYLPTRLDNIVDIEMYADSSPFNNMASLPRRQNSWPKVHISYIQTLISRVAVRVTTKWRKQQYWTEFSPPLLNFTRLHFTSSVFYASMLHECSCHFDKKNVSCSRKMTCHIWNLFIARQLLIIHEQRVCTDSLSGAKEEPQTNPSPFSNLLLTRSSKAMWLLHA